MSRMVKTMECTISRLQQLLVSFMQFEDPTITDFGLKTIRSVYDHEFVIVF